MARLGVARTFQSTALFDRASVLDNLIVGHRLRTRSGLWDVLTHSQRLKHEERICRDKAREALDFVGLSAIAATDGRRHLAGRTQARGASRSRSPPSRA